MLLRQGRYRVVVDSLRLRVHAVTHGTIELAGSIGGGAMCKVSSMHEIHTHDDVPGLDQRLVDGVVGRCAREGLNVDIQIARIQLVGREELRAAATSEGLHRVGIFHSFVISRVRITSIVGQPGAIIQDFVFRHGPSALERIPLGIDVVERARQSFPYG